MSVNWSAILTFITSLAIATPIIKFIFLPSYRIHLRRGSYIEKRNLLENYYNETYLNKTKKNKVILQADTNILLTNDKLSYQTIFKILESKAQYFYRTIESLKFCNLFVKEVKINDDYILKCKYKPHTLKTFYNSILTLYVFLGGLWVIINVLSLVKTGKWLNNSALDFLVLFCALFTIPAAKAKATLKLSKILDIHFRK